MTGVHQVFLAHGGSVHDLDVVACSAQPPAAVAELLRRRGRLLGAVKPETALSYLRPTAGHAVVLRRFRADADGVDYSPGRNAAHALVGGPEVLTAEVALRLGGWPGWRRGAPPDGPDDLAVDECPLADRADLDARARQVGELAAVLTVLLRAPGPRAGLTVLGFVADPLALLWGLYRTGRVQPSLHGRRWTFSTHEDEESAELPEIAVVPHLIEGSVRPAGRGLVRLADLPDVPPQVRDLVDRYWDGADPQPLPGPGAVPGRLGDDGGTTQPIPLTSGAVAGHDDPGEPGPAVSGAPDPGDADTAAAPLREPSVTGGATGPAGTHPSGTSRRRRGPDRRPPAPTGADRRLALQLAAAAGGAAALVAALAAFAAGILVGRVAASEQPGDVVPTAAPTPVPSSGAGPPAPALGDLSFDVGDQTVTVAGGWEGLTRDDRLVVAQRRGGELLFRAECVVLLAGRFTCTANRVPGPDPTRDDLAFYRLTVDQRAQLGGPATDQPKALLAGLTPLTTT